MSEAVDRLYKEIGQHLDITPRQVQQRLVTVEPLVQRYYEWKYTWTPGKTDVPF